MAMMQVLQLAFSFGRQAQFNYSKRSRCVSELFRAEPAVPTGPTSIIINVAIHVLYPFPTEHFTNPRPTSVYKLEEVLGGTTVISDNCA